MSTSQTPFEKGTTFYKLYLIFLKHSKKLNNGYIPDEEWAIQEVEKWKKELKINQKKGVQ